jgi:hypothetical protein
VREMAKIFWHYSGKTSRIDEHCKGHFSESLFTDGNQL